MELDSQAKAVVFRSVRSTLYGNIGHPGEEGVLIVIVATFRRCLAHLGVFFRRTAVRGCSRACLTDFEDHARL